MISIELTVKCIVTSGTNIQFSTNRETLISINSVMKKYLHNKLYYVDYSESFRKIVQTYN